MKILLAALSLTALCVPALAQSELGERVPVPGQLVVCLESESSALDLESELARWNLTAAVPGLRIDSARKLLQWQRRGGPRFTNVVLVEYGPARIPHEELQRRLSAVAGVRWAAPNMALEGDPREIVPNDPSYGLQYHHPKMQSDLAWNTTFGIASVIMGITDDGVDLDHPDLVQNIWVNAGEIAGNGIDDDGNGYVDDVNGWDFAFNGNNPNPDGSDDHGTHVAGIAGARTNNGIGVAGTAGGSTILPLQFYSTQTSWTAADIAESFAYGVDNGARILSTSYNMDGWVGDPTVNAAFDYLYDNGALHFNSAGNNNAANPPRQAFHQSLMVASTDSNDIRSSFSNYGTGIDIAAPGSSVYATLVGGGYGTKSGTSMAAPNAAGAAALVWSAHPTWTRDQVAAALVYFADNIDALNPAYAGLLGSGRANAYRAMTLTMPAPKLVAATGLPNEGAVLNGALTAFELRFDQILDPTKVNLPGAFTLDYAGADGVFGTGDDSTVALGWDEYLISSNRVRFANIAALLGSGAYRVTAHASVLTNPFGTAFDGDGNGTGGDSWSRTFFTCGSNVLLVDNCESGTGWSVANTTLTDGQWDVPPSVPAGGGVRNDPPTDYDGSGRCFLTDNVAGNSDVDGGPTRLTSRAFDCTVTADPYISFARWFLSDGSDTMQVELSNNGTTWVPVATLTSASSWQIQTYRVASYVTPNATVRLRFSVTDVSPGNVVEAGIDYVRILEIACDNLPIGTRYCTAAVNSTGQGARIGAIGSTSVAANDVTLYVDRAPLNKAGLFYFGATQAQTPFGNGFRCVSGGTLRLGPAVLTNAQGVALRTVDLTASPAVGVILPGVTSNFQFWYRDPDAGGASFNLSDAVSITWQ
ncbi:MAG: S8 family serine peptidase [Planctomycetaceae bacterium]|nr:S8 family serine peptidase [Planctomycetaceae bacterium]